MTDAQQLLAEYARNGSEAAFRALVGRYTNLVYSVALRLVNLPALGSAAYDCAAGRRFSRAVSTNL